MWPGAAQLFVYMGIVVTNSVNESKCDGVKCFDIVKLAERIVFENFDGKLGYENL